MKMMLPDVIGPDNQSQHYQHHRCLCLVLSGRVTTPNGFSYHTSRETVRRPIFHDSLSCVEIRQDPPTFVSRSECHITYLAYDYNIMVEKW